ncbi:MAG: DUF4922 domain-containing protein [Wenzhouxiangella sp.]|nr:DUF4922 domain-containing protein [Wenzhouxiangella sp.]
MIQLTNPDYRQRWIDLNSHLASLRQSEGLGRALRALMTNQIESGFIKDELSDIRRYRLTCIDQPDLALCAQFNPARAQRFKGSSSIDPRGHLINDGCFLCAENVQWQHGGAELGLEIHDLDLPYIAWMNPYPLLPCHTVIASAEHLPQDWRHTDGRPLSGLIGDLISIASALPGWIGFYNGVGAGASIPHHLHYHFLPRPSGYEEMPIERAAAGRTSGSTQDACYPIDFMHWHGSPESVLDHALAWLGRRYQDSRAANQESANIIACADHSGSLNLYFVPRDQDRARVPGLNGIVGGFEVMGEIVCSTAEEQYRLDTGDLNYETVADMLAEVSVSV